MYHSDYVTNNTAHIKYNRFTSYLYFWPSLKDLPVTFTSGISYGEAIIERFTSYLYFWHQLWQGHH